MEDEQRQRWTLAADSGLTLQEEYLEDFEEIFSALSAYKAMHPELVYEFSLKDKAYPPDIDAAELEPYLRKALPMIIETYGMLRSISNKVDSRDAVNEATWRVPIDALHMNLFSNKKHAFRGELRNLTGWTSARVKADGNDQ
ncbi:uncharacterized protein PHACADRAFT_249106 [Phanerochaete carnosa HHB-10118-sp]|uniref:Uncharacterized protein n=1 Tax=Phanerochaete carnosa (strain HHB-10118-sp) TaxID=650164 RepID=K5WIN5_PHACS|nr:uncharacterized protein PHACADRAFT_249106 [Phanerochaete carnosa HHB-10118-sp]EKM58969.1 hypothetical protein PHACADRAFT_249106 [Phanerochaete carnosa HHB-10118-sp]